MKIKVSINNIITGEKFSGEFINEQYDSGIELDAEVQERCEDCIALQERKTTRGIGWGWNARVIKKEDMLDKWNPILLEEFDEVDSVSGETITYCRLDKEYTITTEDLTTEHNKELSLKKALEEGNAILDLAKKLHSVCAYHCRKNGLTETQQLELKSDNSSIFQMLKDGQSLSVRPYIEALTADGTLITQEMLNDMSQCYSEFDLKYPDI